ncbi:MAG: hypothetical protein ACOYLB_03235 [Phototrophicaceae bacterium]
MVKQIRQHAYLLQTLGLVVFTVLMIVATVPALPILAGLLFPPSPPVPEGAQEIERTSPVYGTTQTLYQMNPRACYVVQYLQEQGAQCTLQVGHCTSAPNSPKRSAWVGQCVGEIRFSAFSLEWTTDIYDYPAYTELSVSSRTSWAFVNR